LMVSPRGFSISVLLVVLGNLCQYAAAAAIKKSSANATIAANLRAGASIIREAYTTNAICKKNKCINPIFPGMEDLHKLDQAQWICANLAQTQSHLRFCRGAVTYDPALPIPSDAGGASLEVSNLVQNQDNAASTMFYYHLTGLGYEAWDYQKPEEADDCIKSIWRMACFTYFPRSPLNCQLNQVGQYVRPCQSSCWNYVRSCGVECCDESVQCVFTHTKAVSSSQTVTTEGYIPHDGPSSMCTGGAQRASKPFGIVFWAVMMLAIVMSLQGCELQRGIDPTATHTVGNWRGEPDYLIKHQYVPKGQPANTAVLNSCTISTLAANEQCSGRGKCEMWDPENHASMLTFCLCDEGWADPECRTRRKSQLTAYVLSTFFGCFGADQFYLGFNGMGFLKLFTFGGFGILWLMDIVKIGSAPVMTPTYKTDNSLPHYVFVLTATLQAMIIGFCIAWVVTILFRFERRQQNLLRQMEEEKRQWESRSIIQADGPPMKTGMMGPDWSMGMMGSMPPYGTMGPMPPVPPSMGMPPTMPVSGMMNPFGGASVKF